MSMDVAWTVVALFAAISFGQFWVLGNKIDAINGRIDALADRLGGRIDSQSDRIDSLAARLDAHIERPA